MGDWGTRRLLILSPASPLHSLDVIRVIAWPRFGYPEFRSRSHDAVIRVYDEANNAIAILSRPHSSSQFNNHLVEPLLTPVLSGHASVSRNRNMRFYGNSMFPLADSGSSFERPLFPM
jgi:hypothetical protein